MIYKWKLGAHIKADAQIAGEMCEELANEGNLTPEALLDRNRDEDAPLHSVFEWDDGVAAEKYRTEQARHIINCVVIEKESCSSPTRAFVKINYHESEPYEHIDVVVRNEDKMEQMLQQALRELHSFQRKYSCLKQLSNVFRAIDDLSA